MQPGDDMDWPMPLPRCNWQAITCTTDSKFVFVNKDRANIIKIDVENDYRLAATYNFSDHNGTCATSIVDTDNKHLYIVTWDGYVVVFDIVRDIKLASYEIPQRPRYHYC